MNLLVYEGSFDPPHLGHYYLLNQAKEALDAQMELVLPSSDEALNINSKKPNVTKFIHRLEMCELTFLGKSYPLSFDTLYTYEVVERVRELFPNYKINWLVGPDWGFKVKTFKNYNKFKDYVDFIFPEKESFMSEKGYTFSYIYNPINIRSTMIRNRIKEGKTITGLINPSVESYISNNNLYIR